MTLVELLAVRGIPCRRKGAEVQVNCPFPGCRDDTKQQRFLCSVNISRDMGFCFRCKWKARTGAVAKILEAYSIAETPAGYVPEEQVSPEDPQLPEDFQLLSYPDLAGPAEQARRYVLQRGITVAQIERHYVGCSLIGRYRYRVIFPIIYRRLFMGHVARDFTGQQEPRYLFTQGTKSLYNLHSYRPDSRPLVLVEGVFKALRVEAQGWPAVALLGHNLTDEMLAQLLRCPQLPPSVMVWPDADSVGVTGALRVAARLAEVGLLVRVPFPVPRAPADDLGDAEIQAVLATSVPYNWGVAQALEAGRAFAK